MSTTDIDELLYTLIVFRVLIKRAILVLIATLLLTKIAAILKVVGLFMTTYLQLDALSPLLIYIGTFAFGFGLASPLSFLGSFGNLLKYFNVYARIMGVSCPRRINCLTRSTLAKFIGCVLLISLLSFASYQHISMMPKRMELGTLGFISFLFSMLFELSAIVLTTYAAVANYLAASLFSNIDDLSTSKIHYAASKQLRRGALLGLIVFVAWFLVIFLGGSLTTDKGLVMTLLIMSFMVLWVGMAVACTLLIIGWIRARRAIDEALAEVIWLYELQKQMSRTPSNDVTPSS